MFGKRRFSKELPLFIPCDVRRVASRRRDAALPVRLIPCAVLNAVHRIAYAVAGLTRRAELLDLANDFGIEEGALDTLTRDALGVTRLAKALGRRPRENPAGPARRRA